METLEERPVSSTEKPGYLRALLPQEAPEKPQSLEEILIDLEKFIMPGVLDFYILFIPCILINSSFDNNLVKPTFNGEKTENLVNNSLIKNLI